MASTREILQLGARVNTSNRHAKEPHGPEARIDLTQLFLRRDADGFTPLHYAALGHFRFVVDGSCGPVSPISSGFAAAHFAWRGTPADANKRQRVDGGRKKVVARLLEQADIGHASAEVVKALLAAKSDPNEPVGRGELKGCVPLLLAVQTRRYEVVKVLLGPCADFEDKHGATIIQKLEFFFAFWHYRSPV